ncbi:MAG TPA: HAD family hydrolase [Actinomycetota bacterium]|jgi:FMN phosphatase YigB (HAD superfamily)
MTVRAVFFDVGETIVDETRLYGEWADRLNIPRLTFMAVLGAVIERRESHLRTFDILRPGIDVEAVRLERAAAGDRTVPIAEDLYPDAVPCLRRLREAGFTVGLAGNQPRDARDALEAMALPVDAILTSAEVGVEKPSPAFYQAVAGAAGLRTSEIAYVGDRVDNDVVPAADAGMLAVFLRRGPWGWLQSTWPEAARAAVRIDSLDELPEALPGGPDAPTTMETMRDGSNAKGAREARP